MSPALSSQSGFSAWVTTQQYWHLSNLQQIINVNNVLEIHWSGIQK